MTKALRWIWIGIMGAVAAIFVAPLILMVLTSFKPEQEVLNPASVVPKVWTFENYAHVLGWVEEAPFGRWLTNSFFISTSITLLVVLFSSFAAYGITRVKAPGASVFLAIVVGSMMLPGQLFLVPHYLMMSRFHWLDTPLALIIPATAGGFGTFMLCQFMRSVPDEIEEAARLDGCSTFAIYHQMILPLCAPSIATLGIFTFIGSWNDFTGPLIYMDSIRNYTLPVGIALYQSSYYTQYGLTLATSCLATAPLILVFMAFQKQIVESMASTGLKQ